MNNEECISELVNQIVRSNEAFIFECHRHICTTLLNADSVDIQALNDELLEMSKEFYREKLTCAYRVVITNIDGYYTTIVKVHNTFKPYKFKPYSMTPLKKNHIFEVGDKVIRNRYSDSDILRGYFMDQVFTITEISENTVTLNNRTIVWHDRVIKIPEIEEIE